MSDRISSSTPDKRLEKARDFVWGHTDIAHEEALKALHLLRERHLDFGDLFFQRGVSEHFALNDGIIKTCSYNIGRGVGVRAVTGGKSGFAYSHELTPEALYAACRAARSINSDPGVPGINVTPSELAAPPLYSEDDPLGDLSRERKVELLNTLDRLARAADPRVIQVMAGLSCAHQAKVIYTTEEHICCDIKPVVSLTLNVIMEQNGRRESGHASLGGACLLSTLIDGQTCARLVAEACRIATVNLEARPAPGGTLTVVLGAGWPGVLVHEAVGHGLEGDFIRTGSSLFAGRLGEYRYYDMDAVVEAALHKCEELLGR